MMTFFINLVPRVLSPNLSRNEQKGPWKHDWILMTRMVMITMVKMTPIISKMSTEILKMGDSAKPVIKSSPQITFLTCIL